MPKGFLTFFLILHTLKAQPIQTSTADSGAKSFSVVIFFANSDSGEIPNVERIPYLNIDKVADIQPYFLPSQTSSPQNFKVIRGPYVRTCGCKSALKSSISSLLESARNNAKMVVATILLGTDETVNRFKSYNSKIEITNKMDEPTDSNEDNVDNGCPHEFKNSHCSSAILKNLENVRRAQRTVGLSPEQYQTFSVETGGNIPDHEDAPKRFERISPISGFMLMLVNVLFNRNPTPAPKHESNPMETGDVQEYGLLQLVSKTLVQMREQMRQENIGRFLLVVNGGDLSTITNPYSDLMQAVKHVRESTNCEHTLIVVTGDCTRGPSKNLPVYAIGPYAVEFAKAQQLTDIPRIVQQALQVWQDSENLEVS